ncbi:adenylyl-sulfate kinase [Galbibacter mesophilus]|uniref:adenylyl-sulfate kinase n=1 Tax=Galbibacter mesophilus TaxID=379069 RepID=UPI00191D9708|nr:adenylyl-sulfate kinase [Galbibacter mesophilus]MCM5663499.1 adenylyl-sulfate kinase [Galbibacter mesophilus]
MGEDLYPYQFKTTQEDRNLLSGHHSLLIWFTGLSGSGKSTIADALEQKLISEKVRTMVLDGDNVRGSLCKGLDFSAEDRSENLRRVAEIADLLLKSGAVVLASFVSPYKKDREYVEKTIKPNIFVEVFVNTSLETCKKRDPKGLYKRAEEGSLKNLTGFNAPYETPEAADVVVEENESVAEAVEKIYNEVKDKLYL